MKIGIFATVAALATLSVSGIARADSSTGKQNSDLTVMVSLSPDTVATGGTVTETKSVTNNTKRPLDIELVKVLKAPNGDVYRDTMKDRIAPGKTQTSTRTFKVGAKTKDGEYTLTFAAHDHKGVSSAKATTTVG